MPDSKKFLRCHAPILKAFGGMSPPDRKIVEVCHLSLNSKTIEEIHLKCSPLSYVFNLNGFF